MAHDDVRERQQRRDQQGRRGDRVGKASLDVGVQMPRNGVGREQVGQRQADESRNDDQPPPERHRAQKQRPAGPLRQPPALTSRHASDAHARRRSASSVDDR